MVESLNNYAITGNGVMGKPVGLLNEPLIINS